MSPEIIGAIGAAIAVVLTAIGAPKVLAAWAAREHAKGERHASVCARLDAITANGVRTNVLLERIDARTTRTLTEVTKPRAAGGE